MRTGRLLIGIAMLTGVVACGGDDGGGSASGTEPAPTTTAQPATTTTAVDATTGEVDAVVEVGGHGLHLVCSGEGTPVVMVEMGAGQTAADWDFLRSELDNDQRTCVYERAGTGQSEAGPEPRTAEVVADELAALLGAVGVTDPVVLLSHSLGGLDAQAFAELHPDAVAGLVFVEPRTAEYQLGYRDNLTAEELEIDQADLDDAIANAPFGPELAVIDDSAAEVVDDGPLPDVPTVVLTAGLAFPDQSEADRDFWVQTHQDLAAEVTQGSQREVANAEHEIYRTNPDEVRAAVAEVVALLG